MTSPVEQLAERSRRVVPLPPRQAAPALLRLSGPSGGVAPEAPASPGVPVLAADFAARDIISRNRRARAGGRRRGGDGRAGYAMDAITGVTDRGGEFGWSTIIFTRPAA
jgi:hypothetical protein